MAETLTLSIEPLAEPTSLPAQQIGSLPVAVACANKNGCTEPVGVCNSGCMAEFTQQPEPLAVLEAPTESVVSSSLPQ
jgi:hypothetical protein